jgi:hypothetical protein
MNQFDYVNKCAECISKRDLKKAEYTKLNQIDMLSSTGNKLREEINILEGWIATLKWVMGISVY